MIPLANGCLMPVDEGLYEGSTSREHHEGGLDVRAVGEQLKGVGARQFQDGRDELSSGAGLEGYNGGGH